jgi:hypothetical protein
MSVAALLLALWLAISPHTPDLAAATYRVALFKEVGFAVWDERWYGGHDLPGYSLTYAPLAALLGLRLCAALSLLASAGLFARLAAAVYGPRSRWAVAWFAAAAAADIWIGRLAFALAVPFALAAVLLFRSAGRSRWATRGAALCSALCAAASPVAGLLLALAGLTHTLHTRRARALLVLAVPAAAVAGALAALFGEGGWEPYPLTSFLATLGVLGAFLAVLPRRERLLRTGALIYLLACVACVALHTPMGANVERYGVLLAGPLLLCAWARERVARRTRLATSALAVALCAAAVWVAWGPVRETAAVAGDASTSAAYYVPVERFLARRGFPAQRAPGPVRVEVPFTRSHWEAALLAPHVSLARGWEKQLDERFDHVLLARRLTAAGYRRWLDAAAVQLVALPDAPLDGSSAAEGRLVRRGLPYLREVFASRHWRIYAVLAPTPLLSGPGTLTALGHDGFALRAAAPARLRVRVRYSRYLHVEQGDGCVARAAGGWTAVLARRPGRLVVQASFSLSRALGLTSGCGEGARG